MLDIKRIRNDFDEVAKKLATRGVAAEKLAELKELDDKRRELLIKSESAKAERNTASAAIARKGISVAVFTADSFTYLFCDSALSASLGTFYNVSVG